MLKLSIPEAVGYLGWCFFAFSACLLAWIVTKKKLTSFARKLRSSRFINRGSSPYAPVWMIAIFFVGTMTGTLWHAPSSTVYYGLRVKQILPPDSMNVVSPETGPFRADICPENKLEKYQPKPGYVMCRFSYVDRGCMDIGRKQDGFTWVKDKFGSTATLSDQDTFEPWPVCRKNELEASNAR